MALKANCYRMRFAGPPAAASPMRPWDIETDRPAQHREAYRVRLATKERIDSGTAAWSPTMRSSLKM
jgi:hypothetical protein